METKNIYISPEMDEMKLAAATVLCGSMNSQTEDYTVINDFEW